MSDKNIILTIGIPTFNSCSYLEECIEKILIQTNLLDKIEILVCDNASSDNTEKLMNEYILEYPNIIRYIRHNSNLGADRNYWSCIKNSNGMYVHLMGDDDFYINDGLERLLKLITQREDFTAICLSNNFLNTLNNKIIKKEEKLSDDIFCNLGEIFFLSENLKVLTASNIVVKKSECLKIQNIERLFDTNWFHIGLLIEIIKPKSISYIFNYVNPLITVRIGNQRWLEKDGAISYYYSALLVFSNLNKKGYSNKVFNHIKILFWQFLMDGSKINYNNKLLNIIYSFKFFKFYYFQPIKYIKFSMKLILLKHKAFFEGWDKL